MKNLLFLLFLCPYLGIAQQQNIHIGTTIPDVSLDSMVNHATASAKLSHFKGKIIILDFFATWCGSCRNHLPTMDSLQRKFADCLQVIMVSSWNTKDDAKRVNKMIATYNSKNPLPLSIPAVVKDSALLSMFPHKYIPHYVWLDDKLTIKAITDGSFVTEANINYMIQQLTLTH